MKPIIVIVTYCMMSWQYRLTDTNSGKGKEGHESNEGLSEEVSCNFHKDFTSYEEGCIFYNKIKKNKDVSNVKFYNTSASDTVPNFKKEFVYKRVNK